MYLKPALLARADIHRIDAAITPDDFQLLGADIRPKNMTATRWVHLAIASVDG
ncbi:MAG: hypothetical protein JJU08_12225 [Rhodobacteraceae bacterium]|nr:hypothetical protein [Paracoccaceae bacterium]